MGGISSSWRYLQSLMKYVKAGRRMSPNIQPTSSQADTKALVDWPTDSKAEKDSSRGTRVFFSRVRRSAEIIAMISGGV